MYVKGDLCIYVKRDLCIYVKRDIYVGVVRLPFSNLAGAIHVSKET